MHQISDFRPLNIAILTISDTRTAENDRSGDYLARAAADSGHVVTARVLLPDDRYSLRAQVSAWIADPTVQVILTTGGTGFRTRDVTPEALLPLIDQEIPGFGERFRAVSADEIGSSTIQSRVFAGIANGTLLACLPGSTGACRTGWTQLLREQLDAGHRPCNFAELLTGSGGPS